MIGLINSASSHSSSAFQSSDYIGNANQLNDIAEIYKIDEIIFCAKDIPAQRIIDLMTVIKVENIEFKIAPPETLYIIGSNTINDADDLYAVNINSISNTANKRNKRCFDFIVCCMLLLLSPLAVFYVKRPLGYLNNIFSVLFGFKTWVGYNVDLPDDKLPKLPEAVLNPADSFKNKNFSPDILIKINTLYAKDYKVTNDLNIILKSFRSLGRK